MKRKRTKWLFAALVFCLTAILFVGCGGSDRKNGGDDEDDDRLPVGNFTMVDPASVTVEVKVSTINVTWQPVAGAVKYYIYADCLDAEMGTFSPAVELMSGGYVYPADGIIKFQISAVSYTEGESKPVTITYKSEGVDLSSPQISSFNDGVLSWRSVQGADGYILKVNGKLVSNSQTGNGYYYGTSYTLPDLAHDARIELAALGDGNWRKNSPVTMVNYSAAHRSLALKPISDVTVDGDTLRWAEVGGVSGYRAVDLEFNVINIPDNYYDLSASNLVRGIYPVSSIYSVASPDLDEKASIKYLEGAGTPTDPYLIKSAQDLRAIDYYETLYAEGEDKSAQNFYRIENDIDYNEVSKLESESNIYTLTKPFFGVLDGNGKTLRNIRVIYDGGFWALFDYVAPGAEIRNINFKNAEITNEIIDNEHPLGAGIAMLANLNYGTIKNISVATSAKGFESMGGNVAGVVLKNHGVVKGCTISGHFKEIDTGLLSQACYSMGGIVLENGSGGEVSGCDVVDLTIEGTMSRWEDHDDNGNVTNSGNYSNIYTVGGIVGVNRSGGRVTGNKFTSFNVIKLNQECGGIIGKNERGGTASGNITTGTMKVDGRPISATTGSSTNSYISVNIGKSGD